MSDIGSDTDIERPLRAPLLLSLSEGAVRNYLSSAIQKVGGQNRIEAAQAAKRNGWL